MWQPANTHCGGSHKIPVIQGLKIKTSGLKKSYKSL